MEIKVRTSADLAALQRALKRMGQTEMRKRISKVLSDGTKPMKARIKQNTSRLPQSGGLAARVAGASIRTVNRTGARSYGVTLRATSKDSSLPRLNAGKNRHLTFGREPWQQQSVEPGFFEDGIKELAEPLRRRLLSEADQIASEIEKSI